MHVCRHKDRLTGVVHAVNLGAHAAAAHDATQHAQELIQGVRAMRTAWSLCGSDPAAGPQASVYVGMHVAQQLGGVPVLEHDAVDLVKAQLLQRVPHRSELVGGCQHAPVGASARVSE